MARKYNKRYKVGQTVYCRPWNLIGNGMRVYKCIILKIGSAAGEPYYELSIVGRVQPFDRLHVIYNSELYSNREDAILDAEDAIKDYVQPILDHRDILLKELKELK